MKLARPMKQDPDTKGWVQCVPSEATMLYIDIPGPSGLVMLPVQIKGTRKGTGNWTWNGSMTSPTLHPSVLTKVGDMRCHSFITDGMVKFLNDCTHKYKGSITPLKLIDECRYLQ